MLDATSTARQRSILEYAHDGDGVGGARPALRTSLGAVYRVRHLPDDARAAHRAALTLTPKLFGPAAAKPELHTFRVYEEDDDGELRVPRFYGLARFGRPSSPTAAGGDGGAGGAGGGDGLHDGAPMREEVVFAGTLNDDQARAHALTERAVRTHGGCVQVRRAGGGKTVLGIHLAVALGRRTVVFVHKSFLVQQWEERIRTFAPAARIGRIQQHKCDLEADFVIAMIQTVVKRDLDLSGFGLAMVDEAHHMGARVFFSVLGRLAPRFWCGLTATPDRLDGLERLLEHGLGPRVLTDAEDAAPGTVSASSLASGAAREVVHVTRLLYHGGDRRELKNRGGHLNMALMINALAEDVERTAMIVARIRGLYADGYQTLVLSDRLAHLQAMCEQLLAAGVPDDALGFFVGSTPARERARVSQRAIVFASYSMAREALDVPTLSAAVFATPIGSVTQAVGRVTRPCAAKKTPVRVVDIVDTFSIFVFMAKKRAKMYAAQRYPTEDEEAAA